MTKNKFTPLVLALAGLVIAAVSNGCSAASGVCCQDFKPGADMATVDFGVTGAAKGQFTAFAQASGDLIATVGALNADVTNACKGIATDLGVDSTEPDATKLAGKSNVEYWCSQAATAIGTFKAGATIMLVYEQPKCSVDIQANASCNARCDVSGMCDVNATPPQCMGGTLEVSCSGSCTATTPGVAFDCEGSCMGNCSGECDASGGGMVDCMGGKCEGTCMGMGGTDAQGNCQGQCNGKCHLAANAKVNCSGTCRGQCDVKCSAAVMGGSVKCGGKCDAKATPLECKGGKLEAMCNVDASCKGNCDASVEAKAECKPPVITVKLSGNIDAKLDQLRATLEKNLPAIAVVVQARAKAFADLVGNVVSGAASVTAKIDASNVKGVACGVIITTQIGATVPVVAATLNGATSIATTVGM